MTTRAAGTFDVKLNPLEPYNTAADAALGRMSIDKQFRGDLDAISKGEMLTAGAIVGSAGSSRSSGSAARCTAAAARSPSSTAAA